MKAIKHFETCCYSENNRRQGGTFASHHVAPLLIIFPEQHNTERFIPYSSSCSACVWICKWALTKQSVGFSFRTPTTSFKCIVRVRSHAHARATLPPHFIELYWTPNNVKKNPKPRFITVLRNLHQNKDTSDDKTKKHSNGTLSALHEPTLMKCTCIGCGAPFGIQPKCQD